MLSLFAVVTAFVTLLVVRADVVPSEPSPGKIYNEGQTCSIVWDADPVKPSGWGNMNIELMTGDNFNMIHLTTVATNQDGTVGGRFDYTCPQVTVHSAIYFYQFSSLTAANKTWTTRFTIASTSAATTPPANPTQPGSGEDIPWGVGQLADASKATPPPPSAGGGSVSASANTTTVASLPASTSSSVIISSTSAVLPTSSRLVVTTVAAPSTTSSTPNTQNNAANAAIGMFASYTSFYSIASFVLSGAALTLFF